MLLICLPYAGGSGYLFNEWRKHLGPDIEIFKLELSGRGVRFNEPFYNTLEKAVDDIYSRIEKVIDNSSYAIFGHSMGSLLAYELSHKILSNKKNLPKHLFISGFGAPHLICRETKLYKLEDKDFKQRICDLGGVPKEILSNEEVFNFFLPMLRADFKIIEEYKFEDKGIKLPIDISILNGNDDNISEKGIYGWKDHTSKQCYIHTFEGNHFYINNNASNITGLIKSNLLEKVSV